MRGWESVLWAMTSWCLFLGSLGGLFVGRRWSFLGFCLCLQNCVSIIGGYLLLQPLDDEEMTYTCKSILLTISENSELRHFPLPESLLLIFYEHDTFYNAFDGLLISMHNIRHTKVNMTTQTALPIPQHFLRRSNSSFCITRTTYHRSRYQLAPLSQEQYSH